MCQDLRIGSLEKYSAHIYILTVSRQLVDPFIIHQQVVKKEEICDLHGLEAWVSYSNTDGFVQSDNMNSSQEFCEGFCKFFCFCLQLYIYAYNQKTWLTLYWILLSVCMWQELYVQILLRLFQHLLVVSNSCERESCKVDLRT